MNSIIILARHLQNYFNKDFVSITPSLTVHRDGHMSFGYHYEASIPLGSEREAQEFIDGLNKQNQFENRAKKAS